jgi:hypothetical protein
LHEAIRSFQLELDPFDWRGPNVSNGPRRSSRLPYEIAAN